VKLTNFGEAAFCSPFTPSLTMPVVVGVKIIAIKSPGGCMAIKGLLDLLTLEGAHGQPKVKLARNISGLDQ
jgi:hypothetical protein